MPALEEILERASEQAGLTRQPSQEIRAGFRKDPWQMAVEASDLIKSQPLPEPPPPPPGPPPQPSLLGDIGRGVAEHTGLTDLVDIIKSAIENLQPRELGPGGVGMEGVSISPPVTEPVERDMLPPHRPTIPTDFLSEFVRRTREEAVGGVTDIPAGGQKVVAPESTMADRLMGILQTTFAIPRIVFSPLTAAVEQAYDGAFDALPDSVKNTPITLPVVGETTVQALSESLGKPLAVNLAFIALGKMQLKAADMAKTTAMRETLKKQGLIETQEAAPSRGVPSPEMDIPPRPEAGPIYPTGVQPGPKALPPAPAIAVTPKGQAIPRPAGGQVGLTEAEIAASRSRIAPSVTPPAPQPIIPQEPRPTFTGKTGGQVAATPAGLATLLPESGILTLRQAFRAAKSKGLVKTEDEFTGLLRQELEAGTIGGGSGTSSKNLLNSRLGSGNVRGFIQRPQEPPLFSTTPLGIAEMEGAVTEVRPQASVQPKATVIQKADTTTWANRIDKEAPSALKSRAAKIDTVNLADFEAGGIYDYLGQMKLKLSNEATRVPGNLTLYFESAGEGTLTAKQLASLPRALNKTTRDSGMFQISPPLARQLQLSKATTAKDQLRQFERAVLPYKRKVLGTEDPKALALGHLNEKYTKRAMQKEQPPLIAGGSPKGAEVIAEAERTSGYSPLIDPRIRSDVHKEITNTITDYFVQEKIPFDPQKGRLFEQFAEFIETDKVNFQRLDTILQSKGLTRQVLKEAYKEGATEAGRTLQPLSIAIRKLEELQDAGKLDSSGKSALNLLTRLDNIRRGLQTSQLATVIRNIESQGARVLEQGAVEAINTMLAKGFLKESPAAQRGVGEAFTSPFQHLGSPIDSYKLTRKIMRAHPKQETKLFGTIQSDLPAGIEPGSVRGPADAVVRGAEKITRGILLPQKAQEFGFRSSAFLSKLEEGLKAKGMTTPLSEINPATIPKTILEQAVQHAREMTFSAEPRTELGKALVKAVTKLPFLATGPIPYPRFMANAIQHIVDFSPAGFAKLMSPAERAKIAAGDFSTISKATVGSAELLAAWQLRNSKYAGEHWYTIKPYPDDPDPKKAGKRIDLRSFGPLVAPIFMADTMQKLVRGDTDKLNLNDIAHGLLGSTFRAGIGLYALDSAVQAMRGTWSKGMSTQQQIRAVKAWASELLAGYETPLRTLKDFYAEFDSEEAKIRAKRTEPFTGPLKEAIPGVSQSLPELESPTREATPTREAPGLRQLTGVTVTTLNAVEQELAKHNFNYRNILPSQGHPEADQAMARVMGPVVEKGLGRLVQSPRYQSLDRQTQAAILDENLKAIRRAVSGMAKKQLSRQVLFELYLKGLSPRTRDLLLSRPGVVERFQQHGLSP